MKAIDPQIQSQLESGQVRKREAITLLLGGGTFRYVRDNQPREWNSQVWKEGGFVSITQIRREIGLSASSFTVVLAASEEDDMTPTELKNFYNYDFADREVECYDFYIDENGSVVAAEPLVKGYIDKVKWVSGDRNGTHLALSCFDRSLDFSRRNSNYSNEADQNLRSPTDRFFEHASIVGDQTFWWGRKG